MPTKETKKPATAKPAAKPRAKKAAVAAPQKLRIKVRAYEPKVLDASVKQILDPALKYDAKVAGPIRSRMSDLSQKNRFVPAYQPRPNMQEKSQTKVRLCNPI